MPREWPAEARASTLSHLLWQQWLSLSFVLLLVAPAAGMSGLEVKVPIVKWGQKSDRLYLTIPLPEVEDPQVKFGETLVHFSGHSKGQDYAVDLKLLRSINVTSSSHVVNKWSITMEMEKQRKEPCWKRLLNERTTFSWLKKDHDRMYPEDCQRLKEEWRETYFRAKLDKKNPNKDAVPKKKEGTEDADADAERISRKKKEDEDEKKKEEELWETTVKQFRSRAMSREQYMRQHPKKKRRRASSKGSKARAREL